jgi:hypothetical protein
MKDRQTKGKSDSAFHAAGHLIQRAVCLGAIVFIYTSASAANLFMSDGYSDGVHQADTIGATAVVPMIWSAFWIAV